MQKFSIIAIIALFVICIILFFGIVIMYIEVDNLSSEISLKNSEITELKSQLEALNEEVNVANLVSSSFEVRTNYGFFEIYGSVCNTGNQPAYDSRLHVIAFSINGTKTIDAYKELGTIDPKTIVDTSAGPNIYYGGGALQNWTITPEHSLVP